MEHFTMLIRTMDPETREIVWIVAFTRPDGVKRRAPFSEASGFTRKDAERFADKARIGIAR